MKKRTNKKLAVIEVDLKDMFKFTLGYHKDLIQDNYGDCPEVDRWIRNLDNTLSDILCKDRIRIRDRFRNGEILFLIPYNKIKIPDFEATDIELRIFDEDALFMVLVKDEISF